MIVIAALMIAAMNFWTAGVHTYMALNLRHAALGIGEARLELLFAPALLADYFADDRRNAVLTIFNVAIPVKGIDVLLAAFACATPAGRRCWSCHQGDGREELLPRAERPRPRSRASGSTAMPSSISTAF